MTKEELKQEAEEWLNKWELCNKCDHKVQCIEDNAICPQVVEQAYFASAEPREKRIAELIALINAERKRQEKCDDVHLRKIAELEKENAELEQKLEQTEKDLADYQFNYPTIKELQKENAELKEELKGKRCNCMTYLNFKDLEKQLTKAKEIIHKVCYEYGIYDQDLMEEARQILKECK